jgi:Uma2 family endonuclease
MPWKNRRITNLRCRQGVWYHPREVRFVAVIEKPLPADAVLTLETERVGPIRAADFEEWEQDPGNPMELVGGWVVPMSPGTFRVGRRLSGLDRALGPLVDERGWCLALDSRHRLPQPRETVVFPDLVIHCAPDVEYVPRTETVSRIPELVIELLGKETAARDQAPRGAKYLAYQMSGVAEYYYAWPDGREASGFRREGDLFVPIAPDAEGFFASPLLGARLRLAPAALKR